MTFSHSFKHSPNKVCKLLLVAKFKSLAFTHRKKKFGCFLAFLHGKMFQVSCFNLYVGLVSKASFKLIVASLHVDTIIVNIISVVFFSLKGNLSSSQARELVNSLAWLLDKDWGKGFC